MRSHDPEAVYRSVELLQDAVASIMVPLRLTPRVDEPFQTCFGSGRAGDVAVARVGGARGQVDRQHRLITSSDPDLFMAMLDRRGPVLVEQDGRQHLAHRGELVLFDTTRPYRLRYDDPCDTVVVMVPRASLGPHADVLRHRTATPLPGDLGVPSVVSAFLTGLGDRMEQMPGPSGGSFGQALVTLLAAAFGETTACRVDAPFDLTDAIVSYVLANIAEPGLCVESVARRFRISPRKLHRLFAHRQVTFAAWLREERLHRIRRDLSDPAFSGHTVAALAARWGLYDPSHLSRMFKDHFGQTPAEIRLGTPHAT